MPYVAGQYVYLDKVIGRDVPGMDIKSQLPTLERVGLLKAHPFTPEHLQSVNDGNMIQTGEFITMVYCSNCHSPSESGIRPLHRYFPEGIDQARMEKFVKGVLTTGNIAYMPKMPMLDSEIKAISAYLVMNNDNDGDPAVIKAAIQQEVDARNRLAKNADIDNVASLEIVQETK